MKAAGMAILAFVQASALLVAAGPGMILQGRLTDMARDGTGQIWAITSERSDALAVLEGESWIYRTVTALGDAIRAQSLQSLVDGSVACLWSDPTEENQWLVSRHKGGDSRRWAGFRGSLREPRVLGCADGSVVITERGRHVVRIPPDGKNARVITLPDEVFIEPKKQQDGSVSKDHAPIRAMEDGSHQVWLWCPEKQKRAYDWRLAGLVRLNDSEPATSLFRLRDEAPPISAVVSWDEKSLAIAIAGEGLFHFPLDAPMTADSLEPEPEPEKAAFHFIDALFHDGKAWHAITTPQPTDFDVSMSGTLANRLRIVTTPHYDTTKLTNTLWRFEGAQWRPLLRGLDKGPGFHGDRPWVRTPGGLIVASDEFAPWIVPDDSGEKPRRLADEIAFSFRSVSRMLPLGEKQLLFQAAYGDTGPLLWRLDARPAEGSGRAQVIRTRGQALQDSRGRIWCLREDRRFLQWNGKEWITPAIPQEALKVSSVGFIPDDRDRGWLLPMENSRTAICDFTTGKWRTFETLQLALEAQLPRGVKLRVAEHPYYEHAFSRDGRIGGFFGDADIMLYEKRAWRTWKFQDIAGADARLAGTPFFDERGMFSVPVGEGIAWQWDADKGWTRNDELTTKPLGSFPGQLEIAVENEDEDSARQRSGAKDRLGVAWWLDENRKLHKSAGETDVTVFAADEPNPFVQYSQPQRALVDDHGNALLDTSEFGEIHEHIFIRARLPAPQTEAKIIENADDKVRLRLGNRSGGETWFAWRLDGGNWRPVKREKEVAIGPLPAGDHLLEARAYNAELTPDPKTVSLKFTVRLDAEKLLGKLIAELARENLDDREAAARSLVNLGSTVLPRLKKERETAAGSLAWWLDAVMQQIARGQPAPSSQR